MCSVPLELSVTPVSIKLKNAFSISWSAARQRQECHTARRDLPRDENRYNNLSHH